MTNGFDHWVIIRSTIKEKNSESVIYTYRGLKKRKILNYYQKLSWE